jgi:DNA-binding GntR family transcriptional regulator
VLSKEKDGLPVANEYPPIYHLDLTEQTYRVLRDQILKRQTKPGEKLSVEEIASALGVSRTPVVNALKLLEADGLVEILPRKGTFVTKITARDVIELFDVRLMIEIYAAEQIFKRGKVEELLADIHEPLAQMQAAISEESYIDYDTYIESDRDLHAQLVKEVGNQRLSSIYADLNIHMQVARAHYLNTVENAEQAQVEHEAMVNALANRDVESLKRALTDHITHVKERILALLEERSGAL